MNPPQQPRVVRAILLAACVPMVLAYGLCSLLVLFPLCSFLGGNWNQGLFLLWWLVGTAGLVALVYSSATFGSRRLRPWQVLGLVVGMIATLPVILGFFGERWISVSAVLTVCIAGYILVRSTFDVGSSKDAVK
jgi:hypothetical protein